MIIKDLPEMVFECILAGCFALAIGILMIGFAYFFVKSFFEDSK